MFLYFLKKPLNTKLISKKGITIKNTIKLKLNLQFNIFFNYFSILFGKMITIPYLYIRKVA